MKIKKGIDLSVLEKYGFEKSKDNKITLSPYAYRCCEDFAFELCQEQGWFEDKKDLSDLSKDDKKEVYWLNNWQIAVRSYLFWSEAIS